MDRLCSRSTCAGGRTNGWSNGICDIADGVNVSDRCRTERIYRNVAARIESDLAAKDLRVGKDANADEDGIGGNTRRARVITFSRSTVSTVGFPPIAVTSVLVRKTILERVWADSINSLRAVNSLRL